MPTMTTQTFRISLNNNDVPGTLSLDVIVSSRGEIRLAVRTETAGDDVTVQPEIPSTNRDNEDTGSRGHESSSIPGSSVSVLPPQYTGGCSSILQDAQPVAYTTRTISHSTPIVTLSTNTEQDILPAYSRYTHSAEMVPPSASGPPSEAIIHRVAGQSIHPPCSGPRFPPPPPIRPVLRDLYEAMQRGEFIPAILIEEPEQPSMPLNLSGRQRKRSSRDYEYESDGEESDDEEERYMKRSRRSWGPLDFLRLWK
ncbi:hypothetical protein B0H11DRAFT_2189471 [Mycena galericulata]|nr:hypothetical protein B0H11DRAFT_2189471 [Mycena galericulata]